MLLGKILDLILQTLPCIINVNPCYHICIVGSFICVQADSKAFFPSHNREPVGINEKQWDSK